MPGGNTFYYALDTTMYGAYGARLFDIDAYDGNPEQNRYSVGFQGQYGAYTDLETGFVLMGHRYYDPAEGRFITRDPMGYGGGINLYGFAGNNPVNGMDPWGLDWTIGPAGNPWLSFGGAESEEGLKTGLAATGSALSFGAYNGGKYRNETGYGTSYGLAVVGREAALQAVGIGLASKLAKTVQIARAARAAPAIAQITANAIRGRAFEGAAISALGAAKNTSVFASSTLRGSAIRVIPDIVQGNAITEIKDAVSISYTAQIQGEINLAAQRGVPFNLIVGAGSKVSGPLQTVIRRIGGTILRFDASSGAFSPYH